MDLLKKLQKKIKTHHVIALVGIVVLYFAFRQYSQRQSLTIDKMDDGSENHNSGQAMSLAEPSDANSYASDFQQVSGITTTHQNSVGGEQHVNTMNANDLMPKDNNSEFNLMNPSAGDGLANVNLLKAGHHSGIDTVGSSLRNANLQIRSEPANPKTVVSPWMNSTIEGDVTRRPLEIGN